MGWLIWEYLPPSEQNNETHWEHIKHCNSTLISSYTTLRYL